MTVAERAGVYGIETAKGERLQIAAMPHFWRSALLSQTLTESGGNFTAFQVDQYNRHHARIWDAIRDCLACHYRFNHHLQTPFWRHCQNETELGGARPFVEYYQEFGPSGVWGPVLIDPLCPFGTAGYLTILVGQKVPHRRPYAPTQREWDTWAQMRRRNAEAARGALTVAESLRALGVPVGHVAPRPAAAV